MNMTCRLCAVADFAHTRIDPCDPQNAEQLGPELVRVLIFRREYVYTYNGLSQEKRVLARMKSFVPDPRGSGISNVDRLFRYIRLFEDPI